jgi:hypothetical protein
VGIGISSRTVALESRQHIAPQLDLAHLGGSSLYGLCVRNPAAMVVVAARQSSALHAFAC